MIEKTLTLSRENWSSKATLFQACLSLDELTGLAPDWLHPEELEYANGPMISKRKHSYLLGRFCAKKALKAPLNHPNLAEILIQKGVFKQPLLSGPNTQNTQISVAHSGNLGVALAYPTGHPMGIDIERINPKREDLLKGLILQSELDELTQHCSPIYDAKTLFTWVWTAKEALGKALCTGLTVPFPIYEIQNVAIEKGLLTATYKNFRQYKVISFIWEEAVISIALPRHTDITFL